jgi:hypothetical protein
VSASNREKFQHRFKFREQKQKKGGGEIRNILQTADIEKFMKYLRLIGYGS